MPYKTIIVAIDNDETSEDVCRRAVDLATTCAAQLHLIHIVEPLPPIAAPGVIGGAPFPPTPTDEEHQQSIEDANQQLSKLATELGEIVTGCEVIESANTRNAIHEAGEAINAELIIAGSHGRHGLSLFFSGSTANELLKDAPCDVLAVRISDE
ncbi:MAG: universal stress protein [bacterium]